MSLQLPRTLNVVRQTAVAARARNLVSRQPRRTVSDSTTEASATRFRIRRFPGRLRSEIASEEPWGRPLSRLTPQKDVKNEPKHPKLKEPKHLKLNPTRLSMPIKVYVPGSRRTSWSPIWLRENCQCSNCVHPETRQRLVTIESIPIDIAHKNLSFVEGKGLEIEWSDGHMSTYSSAWLRQHKREEVKPAPDFRSDMQVAPSEPSAFPTVPYDEVMASDEGVREWTQKIHAYGFCFVRGCPIDPEATKKLLERIAFIRRTHYGDFWDFTSNLALKDMAYTTEGLGVHTDTAYFTDPAGLQMFHLLSHTGGEGGESVLVDGFEAARILHTEIPDAYKMLSKPVFGHHASGNQDVCIKPMHIYPTLIHNPMNGELCQVRWNNEDRAAATRADTFMLEQWYTAAQKWAEILRRPNLVRQFKLEPGTPLIFDNWRMLHGRTAFTGARRMCGGYINHDDFRSRHELLNKGREQVLLEL